VTNETTIHWWIPVLFILIPSGNDQADLQHYTKLAINYEFPLDSQVYFVSINETQKEISIWESYFVKEKGIFKRLLSGNLNASHVNLSLPEVSQKLLRRDDFHGTTVTGVSRVKC